jgi:hypothetical protein
MTDWGTDLLLVDAFPATFPLLGPGDPRLVVHAVFRRWTTDPNSEAGRRIYAGKCRDVRQLLGARFDRAILAGWERDLVETAREDDRVGGAVAQLAPSSDRKVLTLRAQIAVGASTSTLILPITSPLLPRIVVNG